MVECYINTNMKYNKAILALLFALALALPSCKDYLTAPEPGATSLSDFFTSKEAAIQNVNGCYVPLMWEFNNTYFNEWFIGDVVSDDALKGGQDISDMAAVYDMENWQTISSNAVLLYYYRAQYQGVARCNLALKYIPAMEPDSSFTPQLQHRLMGEAHYLRAFYYFRLLRVFGGVPLTTQVIDSEDQWEMERASVSAVFAQIVSDLELANQYLLPVSAFRSGDATQLGRATKGAAQAMLLKTYLYMASPYWNSQCAIPSEECYASAKAWGDSIILSQDYDLTPSYASIFTLAEENNIESVFEIQYAEVPWGDYGEGVGYTAGSFTQVMTRSRDNAIGGGWGFNHPTQNLYQEYEQGDPRCRATILDTLTDGSDSYLGNSLLSRKYAMYNESKEVGGGYGAWTIHASRGPMNNRCIRYADVLLMYAEACLGLGDEATCRTYINRVRSRVGLGEVGTYSFQVNGQTLSAPTTEQCLRHERRVELAMEGHRWFDLVRWGNTKAHMDAYAATESQEVRSQMATFQAGKHELFPIPYDEITLDPKLTQNNGY